MINRNKTFTHFLGTETRRQKWSSSDIGFARLPRGNIKTLAGLWHWHREPIEHARMRRLWADYLEWKEKT